MMVRLRVPAWVVVTTVLLLVAHVVPLGLSAQEEEGQKPPSAPQSVPLKATSPPDNPPQQVIPTKAQDAQPAPQAKPMSWRLLCLGGALGFFIGLARLLARFYRFWGMGVVMNPYSAVLLALVTVMSGLSDASFASIEMSALGNWKPLGELLIAAALGNTVSAVGRIRVNASVAAITSQVKDLSQFTSGNFLYRLILESVAQRMDTEIEQMARQYDWNSIRDSIQRVVENEMALDPTGSKECEETLQFITQFTPSTDPRTEFNNKYRALHRAIRVTSFRQLRTRLKYVATHPQTAVQS